MESSLKKKVCNRKRRAMRTRFHVRGNREKPRLCVIKTNKHMHVQLIDDDKGHTLASASTLSKEFKEMGKNKESAKQLGVKIAKLASGLSIQKAVFDRGSFKFHGVIAALAQGAREAGLEV